MRALRLLKLPQTSNVKNLQMGSSNSCENGSNGLRMSKNPQLGFYDT
jgi:hypothetical protein